MKFEQRLLTNFRQHFVNDLDQPTEDFFNTYRFLDWERDRASNTNDMDYEAQVFTLLGMLEEFRDNPNHGLKYFQLAYDMFERVGNEEARVFMKHKISKYAAIA